MASTRMTSLQIRRQPPRQPGVGQFMRRRRAIRPCRLLGETIERMGLRRRRRLPLYSPAPATGSMVARGDLRRAGTPPRCAFHGLDARPGGDRGTCARGKRFRSGRLLLRGMGLPGLANSAETVDCLSADRAADHDAGGAVLIAVFAGPFSDSSRAREGGRIVRSRSQRPMAPAG